MSDQAKNGGNAFPCETYNGHLPPGSGMSLRDWFAGQALSGLCANETDEDRENQEEDPIAAARLFAAQAYMLADAMLAARGDA